LIPLAALSSAVELTAMVLPSPLSATVNPNWSSFIELEAFK
jgi:hypothetical protein